MQGGAEKLLVRRKGAGMPKDLGRGSAMAERIDWYKTTLLNLVIQASFLLTVATCRSAHLRRHLNLSVGAVLLWGSACKT